MPPVYISAAMLHASSCNCTVLPYIHFGQTKVRYCTQCNDNENTPYLQESSAVGLVQLPQRRPPRQKRMGVSRSGLQALALQVTVLSVYFLSVFGIRKYCQCSCVNGTAAVSCELSSKCQNAKKQAS